MMVTENVADVLRLDSDSCRPLAAWSDVRPEDADAQDAGLADWL